MALTPFSQFANATLIFKVPRGLSAFGDYGHRVDVLDDLTITAMLKPARDPSVNFFDGANQDLLYVEGRCIDPISLPESIKPQAIADAVVNGLEFKFRLEPQLVSPFYPEARILGQPLRGYLIGSTVWSEAA